MSDEHAPTHRASHNRSDTSKHSRGSKASSSASSLQNVPSAQKGTLDAHRDNHRSPTVLLRLAITHLAMPATRSSLTRRTDPTEIPLCCRIDSSPNASTKADCCPADKDVCVYSETTVCWQPARHLWQWDCLRGNTFKENSQNTPVLHCPQNAS